MNDYKQVAMYANFTIKKDFLAFFLLNIAKVATKLSATYVVTNTSIGVTVLSGVLICLID